jgi:hypothetical protein
MDGNLRDKKRKTLIKEYNYVMHTKIGIKKFEALKTCHVYRQHIRVINFFLHFFHNTIPVRMGSGSFCTVRNRYGTVPAAKTHRKNSKAG